MIASPKDMVYFIEIAKSLNISRASERLGISQPSLSLAVQRLEKAVGTPLLNRNKRGVQLTQAGKQFQIHIMGLLESWDYIKDDALASMNNVQGNYTIGCHTSVALNLLSRFLPEVMRKHPKININLKHDLSRNITDDVINMKLDIGIVVNPIQHLDLIIHSLYKGEVTFWTAADITHPIQDIKSGEAVLITDPNLIRTESMVQECVKKGVTFSRTILSSSLEVVADLVSNGCGIGILPVNVALSAKNKLVRVLDTAVFYDDNCLVYRVENKNIRSIQMLSNLIRGSVKV